MYLLNNAVMHNFVQFKPIFVNIFSKKRNFTLLNENKTQKRERERLIKFKI
jgi:hypothetical protein